jgi:hypothetical protein
MIYIWNHDIARQRQQELLAAAERYRLARIAREDPEWHTVLKGRRGRRGLEAEAGAKWGNRRPGSFQLLRTPMEHDLVDYLRLKIYPVVLVGRRAPLLARRATRSPCASWTPRPLVTHDTR